jgi:hypothetical protein
VNTEGAQLNDYVQQANQLEIDPAVYDTSPIRSDWEQVSGLQDAARSVVVQPKTATEAAISDQSLAARVSEFRDQVEDWLTEIAQYASELCLLAMTPAQVETIMGAPTQPDPRPRWHSCGDAHGKPPAPPAPPTSGRRQAARRIARDRLQPGADQDPRRLHRRAEQAAAQDNWNKALQLLMPMIDKIRQVEAAGGMRRPSASW